MSFGFNDDAFVEGTSTENKAIIKRKFRRAVFKSALSANVTLASFFILYCPDLFFNWGFIFIYLFCFAFVHNAFFAFCFGRDVTQYGYDYSRWDDRGATQRAYDAMNLANGFPAGLPYRVPKSSSRN